MIYSQYLDGKTNSYGNGYLSSPFAYDSNGAYGSPFASSKLSSGNIFDPAFGSSSIPNLDLFNMNLGNLGNSDVFSTDLFMLSMFMSNQMPMPMQQYYFTESYNTKTDLKALKNLYNPATGNKLANIAYKNASRTNTVGWCAKGTNDSLELAGLSNGEKRVASAYQEADKLEQDKKHWAEVPVSRDDLKKLPAGCIIVWNKNPYGFSQGDIHGHVTITLGNGQEASDHVQNLIMLNTSYKVFVPR